MSPGSRIIIASPTTHVMGESLNAYVTQKIHQNLLFQDIKRIVISGAVRRELSARIATFERAGRVDYRRPTAESVPGNAVNLYCFPSPNFVLHYASLVATYMFLNGRSDCEIELAMPNKTDAARLVEGSNLKGLGSMDLVIIGDVHMLENMTPGQWQGSDTASNDLFCWKRFRSCKDKNVALVGCREKLWGEAGSNVIHALSTFSKIKDVIYIAKAGSMSRKYGSNEWIATGDQAFVDGEVVEWRSLLQGFASENPSVASGPIVTVQSTLCEDKKWLEEWTPRTTWVDCEVGYMARTAVKLGLGFAFLHVVSDNLHQTEGENLSNEDTASVAMKRGKLYGEIIRLLEKFLVKYE